MKDKAKPLTTIRAALYARVSSEQQAQQNTIASQLTALRERLQADGLSFEDELCFLDDGYSGSTLVRPALERLRDVAWAGGFTRLYVHSPDRLARKYAWQVLLVEELQRCGIEIVFLNRTLGVSPEEDLLLQMQGMIAEYERAKIMERSRRGKRHAARRGSVNVLCAAPYGYRYLSKHAGAGQAQYQVVFEEARVVRQVFEWVGRDRLSLRAVGRRLRQQGVPSAKGKAWHVFTIRKLLTNPAYKGAAVFGKTRVGERRSRLRPARGQPEQPRSHTSRYPGVAEDQITIAVPALVSPELFAAVAEQLAENRRHYRQQAQSPGYLLQGLLVCGGCGYGWYGKGISRFTKNEQTPYPYYRCSGMDAFRFGGTKVCPHRPIRLDRLDAAVWADVCQLLQNPKALREEFERRFSGDEEPDLDLGQLDKQIKSVQRGISRLIDAYEEGLLEKTEFEPRAARARERLTRLQREAATAQDRAAQRKELRQVLGQLEDFAAQVRRGLERAEFAKQREIIRCLVKAIKIEEEHIRITYRVSPRPFAEAPSGGTFRQHCHRRVQRHSSGGQHEGDQLPVPEDGARQVRSHSRRVTQTPRASPKRPHAGLLRVG
jgi:site-specific DNA recombinase